MPSISTIAVLLLIVTALVLVFCIFVAIAEGVKHIIGHLLGFKHEEY